MENFPARHAAAALLLFAAGSACADVPAGKSYTPERFERTFRSLEESADARFMHMGPQHGMLKSHGKAGNGELVADALLRLAMENAGPTNRTQEIRFEFAVTWLDEFGGTNALPFLLEEMKQERFRGLSLAQLSVARHMTVASFFRIANRENATDALRAAAEMLADEKWGWMRNECYYESTQTVALHEACSRSSVAKAGGGVVNLRPVREPICGFLADCYESETDPGRFAFLDGFIRSKLGEWKTSERRLAGARRMLGLHPESKAAADVVRSVQEARAAAPRNQAGAGNGGEVSDTETVAPATTDPMR